MQCSAFISLHLLNLEWNTSAHHVCCRGYEIVVSYLNCYFFLLSDVSGCDGYLIHVFFQLYDLMSGELLCSFVFDNGITSLIMDAAELNLFAGSVDGTIYQVELFKPVSQLIQ